MSIGEIVTTLRKIYGKTPMEDAFGRNEFQFLAAVMLSARSRDSMTIPVARKLFELAPTPEALQALPASTIENILHPIGFYRTKTMYLLGLSRRIIEEFAGTVPRTFEGLTSLPGVSRKVANVVLGQLYGQDVIAVDTHVHRISNRIGWVRTATPKETENELMKVLPQKYWRPVNGLLVQHGQQICLPVYPRCEVCPISQWCRYGRTRLSSAKV